MRVLTAIALLIAAVLAGCGGTLRVGNVPKNDPNYNTPGVVVGSFQMTEREGRRNTVWYCAGGVENLRSHLDRNLPVQAVTRNLAEDLFFRQVTTRPGRACGYQTVFRVHYRLHGYHRGVPIYGVYSDRDFLVGHTIRRQW